MLTHRAAAGGAGEGSTSDLWVRILVLIPISMISPPPPAPPPPFDPGPTIAGLAITVVAIASLCGAYVAYKQGGLRCNRRHAIGGSDFDEISQAEIKPVSTFDVAFDPITLLPNKLPLPLTIGLIRRQRPEPPPPEPEPPTGQAGATLRPPPRQAPLFAIGAKVLVLRADGRSESRCTVVALPDEDDFNVYTVQLDGTTATKQCSPDQMRLDLLSVPSTSAATTTYSQPATSQPTMQPPQEPFPLGSKVVIKRSNGGSSLCTVVEVPSGGESAFYTVGLEGTTGRKQCTRDQMRTATDEEIAASSSKQRFRNVGQGSTSAEPTQPLLPQEPQQVEAEVDAATPEAGGDLNLRI